MTHLVPQPHTQWIGVFRYVIGETQGRELFTFNRISSVGAGKFPALIKQMQDEENGGVYFFDTLTPAEHEYWVVAGRS